MIAASGVSRKYEVGPNAVWALRDVSFRISSGDFVAIRGRSGSGKTTLLGLIGAMDEPTEGEVYFEGTGLRSLDDRQKSRLRALRIGFLFQDQMLLPHLTIEENAALPLQYGKQLGRRKMVMEILERLEIARLASRRPREVSGGERVRAGLARALAANPACVLADEPTGNLDHETSIILLDLLREFNREGKTVIVVSHDPMVETYANRVLHLSDGKLFT
jgi:ABC-type lipoprotein export system ATPase subunit